VGDGSAALDNYRIVRAFMERYPQYAKNDLYLASESYGGHYIPMLAKVMVDKEAALAAEQQLNFKGFMIGNPYNNPGENNYGSLIAFWGHQLLPLSLWEVRNDVGSTHGKTRACRRIAASISSLHALLVVVGKLKEGKMMLVFPTARLEPSCRGRNLTARLRRTEGVEREVQRGGVRRAARLRSQRAAVRAHQAGGGSAGLVRARVARVPGPRAGARPLAAPRDGVAAGPCCCRQGRAVRSLRGGRRHPHTLLPRRAA
jgi:hypothetical protein